MCICALQTKTVGAVQSYVGFRLRRTGYKFVPFVCFYVLGYLLLLVKRVCCLLRDYLIAAAVGAHCVVFSSCRCCCRYCSILSSSIADPVKDVPPGRLVHLLKQAYAYQIEFNRYNPKVTPKVTRYISAACIFMFGVSCC